ncbi:MAG: hypothetical protein ACI32N_05650 [Bulleidia sp.]
MKSGLFSVLCAVVIFAGGVLIWKAVIPMIGVVLQPLVQIVTSVFSMSAV